MIVVTRTANNIQAIATAATWHPGAAGKTRSIGLKLPESNQNVFADGTAPQADVRLTARDTRTGSLSLEKQRSRSGDMPTYVAFNADDFPSTVPTVVRVTLSPTNPTIDRTSRSTSRRRPPSRVIVNVKERWQKEESRG